MRPWAPCTGYTVAVTADRRWDEQTQLLERRGARVVHGPTIRTLPAGRRGPAARATEALIADPPDVVVFTTGLGVRSWLAGAEGLGLGDELLDALRPAHGARPRPQGGRRGDDRRHRRRLVHAERAQRRADAAPRRRARRADACRSADGHDRRAGSRCSSTGRPTSGWPRRWPTSASTSWPCPSTGGSCPRTASPARRVLQGVVDGSIDAVTFTAAHAVTNFFTIADELGVTDQVLAAFAVGTDRRRGASARCAPTGPARSASTTPSSRSPPASAPWCGPSPPTSPTAGGPCTLGGPHRHPAGPHGPRRRRRSGAALGPRARGAGRAVRSARRGGVEGRAAATGVGRRDRRARRRGHRRPPAPAPRPSPASASRPSSAAATASARTDAAATSGSTRSNW